ncbi:hypothetical protein C3L33_16710, partial [Rhododendron williamsianum]
MYLYNLTLHQATGIICAINGNFSGGKTQEIVVARGKVLDLLRPDGNGDDSLMQVHPSGIRHIREDGRVNEWQTPGKRTIVKVGSNRLQVVIALSGGELIYFEVDMTGQLMEVEKHEMSGDVACLDIAPVPKGDNGAITETGPFERAVAGPVTGVTPVTEQVCPGCIARDLATWDTAARLTISSPLEAHKSHTITYNICGVDCGFDNPVFAAIELDYSEADQDSTGAQKVLTFYELDLGLNHVSRNEPGSPGVRAVIPRRGDLPAERGVLVVSAAMHKQKSMFFFLLQTEYGDIFKVTLDHDNDRVKELKIKYFDTIPVTSSLCVLKSGFLFAASEFGNHALYQFQAIGDEPDVESSSATLMETEDGYQPVFFQPRKLKNLVRIDQVESMMPIMDMKVANLFDEETPQLFSLCGRGPRSSLRILRPGLAISEMAVSQLPGVPSAVWTVKKNVNDEFDAYIVISFANATLVLSIGETVEEVENMENGGDDEDKEDPFSDEQYGYPKAESEKWVSCIRVLDPRSANTTCLLELQDNEAAFSICMVNFHDKEYGTLLAVGKITCWNRICAQIVDLGKRRLLRKCENKMFPNSINSIHTYRDRIYVGDIQESFHYCKYRRDENQLYIFADDSVPRWLTASYHIDFDTMAGADKFGNIYFVRLPQDVSDEIEEDPTGGKIKWEQGKLNGAPNKVEEIVQFHVGDVVHFLAYVNCGISLQLELRGDASLRLLMARIVVAMTEGCFIFSCLMYIRVHMNHDQPFSCMPDSKSNMHVMHASVISEEILHHPGKSFCVMMSLRSGLIKMLLNSDSDESFDRSAAIHNVIQVLAY